MSAALQQRTFFLLQSNALFDLRTVLEDDIVCAAFDDARRGDQRDARILLQFRDGDRPASLFSPCSR